jgi:hypothetical protein
MDFQYPNKSEIDADIQAETTAINVAVSAIDAALADFPLSDAFRAYAAILYASRVTKGNLEYLDEVVSEMRVLAVR